jgi:hypothetical protein
MWIPLQSKTVGHLRVSVAIGINPGAEYKMVFSDEYHLLVQDYTDKHGIVHKKGEWELIRSNDRKCTDSELAAAVQFLVEKLTGLEADQAKKGPSAILRRKISTLKATIKWLQGGKGSPADDECSRANGTQYIYVEKSRGCGGYD